MKLDVSRVVGKDCLVHIAEHLSLASCALFFDCEVIAPHNHILRGRNNGLAVGKLHDIVGRKHEESRFRLRFHRKRHVNRHLVAVKVRVESRAGERVQFKRSALYEHGFKRLYGKPVQRRRAVEHDGVVLDDFFQHVPHLAVRAFYSALCALDVLALIGFHQLFHDKGLEQLQSHFLGETALMQFKLWTDHDNGTSGVVNALAQKVLTETPLLAAQKPRQGFKLSVACAAVRTLASAVVNQAVHRLLKHSLFVANQYIGSVDFLELFKSVVSVYNAAVKVVEVACRVSAAVQRNHRSQLRRNNGQHVKNHPFGFVARAAEGLDYFKTFDCPDTFLSRSLFQRLS